MKRKWLAVGIILLFVVTLFNPSTVSIYTSRNFSASTPDVNQKENIDNKEIYLPIPHRPIWIYGNEDLTRWKGVRSGNGTWDDPYIISRWYITGIFQYIFGFGFGYGIAIGNTDKYIVIRDNYLNNWRDRNLLEHSAIYLYNTKNVTIENNSIRLCNRAIHFLEGNTGTIIRNNSISNVNSYAIIGVGGVIENNTLINCDTAISCSNSAIRYNMVFNAFIGIGTRGPCSISHNELIENNIGIGCYWAPHSCNITENKIQSNQKGLYLIEGSKPEIHYNNFDDNDGGITYPDTFIINATLNWWGAANGPSGSGPGDGDYVCDYVAYDPWLTEPNPDAGR
jgi:parallel beta-helix repeat protein